MELRSGKTLSKSLSATMKKGEELSMPLREELVERILAMVSFPQIFKARALSKSWQARLSSISSQDDEEMKLLAVSFQKRVSEWVDKWKTFSPSFLFDDFLIAHDYASQRWRKIPTLPVLPLVEAMKLGADTLHQSMAGALLFITGSRDDSGFVVNIFTGSWKQLPALSRREWWVSGTQKRLVIIKEMYKVISLYQDVGCACAWIYDSELGACRTKRVEVREALQNFKLGRWFDAYLNGILYVIVCVQQKVWGFLAFNVKDETFNLLQMPPTIIPPRYLPFLQVVTCSGNLYSVVPSDSRTVILLEADLVSRQWSKVISGPPAALKFGFFWHNVSSDGDCLFFEGRHETKSNGKILTYNVRKDEWSYFPMDRILKQCIRSGMDYYFDNSFQPGINPFLEV